MHEGTTQVRKFKIFLLFTKYEVFKIKQNEALQEMITRLTSMVNELSFLEKVLSTEKYVEKVLRILPKSKWDVKVTIIREVIDLTRMSLDELVGNLKTYEINIDKLKRDTVSKEKSLPLKASDSDEFELGEEQVAFITKNFKMFLRKRYVTKKEQVARNGPNANN